MPALEHLRAPGGERLDKLLATLPSVGSRERARQAIRSGKVFVDGRPIGERDAALILGPGSTIEVRWNQPGTALRLADERRAGIDAGVAVVHRDAAVLVANKPPGLLTDAADERQARSEDTLRKRVTSLLGHDAIPAHRIDRWTSGLVCFARSRTHHDRLAAQWADHTPTRRYLALVEGQMVAARGHFADWMRWDEKDLKQVASNRGVRGAVLAEADWTTLEQFDNATLIEVRLVTGRRNQIRLHASLCGHPLVGERLYRDRPPRVLWTRYALHAAELGFRHPEDDQPVRFEVPLPDDFETLLKQLRGHGG